MPVRVAHGHRTGRECRVRERVRERGWEVGNGREGNQVLNAKPPGNCT